MKVPFTHRQPVIYDGMEGWINFISTSYVTICVREWERSKEEQEGDHYLEDALQLLIELRNDARKRKDFATSDKIRDELSKAGIVLQDGPQETTFTLK